MHSKHDLYIASSRDTVEPAGPDLPKHTGKVAGAAGALIAAALIALPKPSAARDKAPSSPYTMRQLGELPQRSFTIKTSEGAWNAVKAVDPNAIRTNDALTNQLEGYVQAQVPEGQGGELVAGEKVEVPDVPPTPTDPRTHILPPPR